VKKKGKILTLLGGREETGGGEGKHDGKNRFYKWRRTREIERSFNAPAEDGQTTLHKAICQTRGNRKKKKTRMEEQKESELGTASDMQHIPKLKEEGKISSLRIKRKEKKKGNGIHMGDTFFNGFYPVKRKKRRRGKKGRNNTDASGHGPLGNQKKKKGWCRRDRVQKLKKGKKKKTRQTVCGPGSHLGKVDNKKVSSFDSRAPKRKACGRLTLQGSKEKR